LGDWNANARIVSQAANWIELVSAAAHNRRN
jgi:hypothetical protein